MTAGVAAGWTRERIDERVDVLAEAHDGDDFVRAVSELAEELDDAGRQALGEILLERADEERVFQEAMRQRIHERGWIRRTFRRLEAAGASRGASEEAARIAAALTGGPDARGGVREVEEALRAEPPRTIRILDELSRHPRVEVRAWVVEATELLPGGGGVPVLLGLARDRDDGVRRAAIRKAATLDPERARALAPRLRRKLAGDDLDEALSAMWALAALGDRESAGRLRRVADGFDEAEPARARTAAVVVLLLEGREAEIVERIRRHDHEHMEPLAAAAAIVGGREALDALERGAEAAPDLACRELCGRAASALRHRSGADG